MKTTAYAILGALVLTALTWAHFTGWAPSAVIHEDKAVPKSVRDAGSYRSPYRSYTGAK